MTKILYMKKIKNSQDLIQTIFKNKEIKERALAVKIAAAEKTNTEDMDRLVKVLDAVFVPSFDIVKSYLLDKYNIKISFPASEVPYWSEDGKDIEDRLEELIKVYLRDTEKNLNFLWSSIDRIINTEIDNQVNETLLAVAKKEGYEVMCRVSISEGQCPFCVGNSALVWDPDEIDPPPYHPNCMCTIDIVEEEYEPGSAPIEIEELEFD